MDLTVKPLVVNLFGAPGAGKSTGAAYIFAKLKMLDVNAELITEYAKDKTWEQNAKVFKNQAYVFGKQSYRMSRCANQVDVIITDSPLPLSIMYNKDQRLSENFNKLVMDVFNSYCNINYLILRNKPYNPAGRNQTEAESDILGESVTALLETQHIPYCPVNGNLDGYEKIIFDISGILHRGKI